jgi:hypothetical protein
MENTKELRESADSDELGWAAFYERWRLHFGTAEVKAGQLLEEFEADDAISGLLGDRGEASRKQKLGLLIKRRIGVVSGGLKVERTKEYGGSQQYRIVGALPRKSQSPNKAPNLPIGSNGRANGDDFGAFGAFGAFEQPRIHTHTGACAPEPAASESQSPKVEPSAGEKPQNKAPNFPAVGACPEEIIGDVGHVLRPGDPVRANGVKGHFLRVEQRGQIAYGRYVRVDTGAEGVILLDFLRPDPEGHAVDFADVCTEGGADA